VLQTTEPGLILEPDDIEGCYIALIHMRDLYKRAGIEDIAEFYRTRYVSAELLDSRYFHWINRFDIRWARTMWIYHNVRPGSHC
jgi:hypothetical protein